MDKWITDSSLSGYPEITQGEIKDALSLCVLGVLKYLDDFDGGFPQASSIDNNYIKDINKGWTTGFYTGEVWLAYEKESDPVKKDRLKEAANKQVASFYQRIKDRFDVEHHDMGFLFSPSCVAAYKLTGSNEGREAALMAADKLITRFQPVGEFIQAWVRWELPIITGL